MTPVHTGALLVNAVVCEVAMGALDIAVCDPEYKSRRQKAARQWGKGAALIIRVEPEEESWRYADCKHYYGHLLTPVAEHTGETVAEVHMRMKVAHMPDDGRVSITQLNRQEFKAYMEAVEQAIREETPEAWEGCVGRMALY